MFPHLRRLLAGAFALMSLIAFSVAGARQRRSRGVAFGHPPSRQARATTTGITTRSRSTTAAIRMPTTTAARAMATATSSRLLAAAALVAVLALAGCGGAARQAGEHAAGTPARFAWLRPAAAPADWKIGRLPSAHGCFAYPPGWRSIRTDPGTFSAALLGAHDRIRGYLNATPRSGAETLANWSQLPPGPQPRRGRPQRHQRGLGIGVALPFGNGFVRHRPLRDHDRRALSRDRLHRPRRAWDHGGRCRRPPRRLAAVGAATRARGGQLLDLSPRPRWRADQPLATTVAESR